jgi:cytoskeletal protein CcmA (bactofilin family)
MQIEQIEGEFRGQVVSDRKYTVMPESKQMTKPMQSESLTC